MNTLKTCWMIASLILLSIAVLLLLQIRKGRDGAPAPSAPVSPAQHSVTGWKYDSFQYDGPVVKELGKTLRAQLINYNFKTPDSLEAIPSETNSIHGAEEILTEISKDGWEYLWTDGKSYLVRRPIGEWKHPYFIIEYQEEPK